MHWSSHTWTTATRYWPTCHRWRLHPSFVSSILLHGLFKISRRQDSVSLVMMELHCLPLPHRITFKLCTLIHSIPHGHGPKYMMEMVLPISTLPGRERLRSASTQNYDICRIKLKFGERAFSVAAPKAWNSLPDSLKQINDIVKFRKDLKTHLFNLAYN